MKSIGKPIVKKDAYALLSGQPVYTDDLATKDCLIVKLLRSPHAYAGSRTLIPILRKKFLALQLSIHIKMFRIFVLPWLVNHIQNQVLMIERS